MQNPVVKNIALSMCLLMLLCTACSRQNNQQSININGLLMGTSYSVVINAPAKQLNKTQISAAIAAELAQIDGIMSTYKEDSELMQFNRTRHTDWVSISDPLYSVIQAAQQISQLSDGAFDITIGPLVNLWGFGPEPHQTIPSAAQLRHVKRYTGYTLLSLDNDNLSVRKADKDLFIDLSAIAKGYAVDKIAQLLQQHQLRDYMIEIGGEVRASGLNADNNAWQIGIEKPHARQRAIQAIIPLKNMALATSGDYRNFFQADDRRYSHIINPVTAEPVKHELISVTVLHPSCMMADALATALLISGLEKGLELAEKENLAVLFITKNNKALLETASSVMQSLWKQ